MMRLGIWLLAVVLAALVLVTGGITRAQEKPAAPPTLTDVQKLQILNAVKDVEIAQLRLDAARLTMQTLLAADTPAGYQITDKLELAKLPDPPKEHP